MKRNFYLFFFLLDLESLINLMKKTQTERFKEKISGLVYNIRMKKYHEKLDRTKEELQVLEERLKRFG